MTTDEINAENDLTGLIETENFIFGRLRDALLEEMKALPEVWQKLSQSAQDEVIERIDRKVRHVVELAAIQIATHDFPTMQGEVEQVVFKDGIKAVIKLRPGDPMRHELADAHYVNLVLVETEQFMGGGEIQSDPDQKDLVDPNE